MFNRDPSSCSIVIENMSVAATVHYIYNSITDQLYVRDTKKGMSGKLDPTISDGEAQSLAKRFYEKVMGGDGTGIYKCIICPKYRGGGGCSCVQT